VRVGLARRPDADRRQAGGADDRVRAILVHARRLEMLDRIGVAGTLLDTGVLIAQIDAPAGEATQDALQRLVDQRAGRVLEITGSHWLTTFEIHHAQVPAYRHGRVFLAGDAATCTARPVARA
jgi:2-polyprenyl-6-methoxyphenol hydroxylase-like FAD-dependent oxidoreductase